MIKRKADGYPNGQVDEYWICVRPAFGKEGKEDSHWVCLNVLPKKNVEFYHSDTSDKDYYLPKGLGTNEEHMQNLAEMLYAIYNPKRWEQNVSYYADNESKLKMFHDFSANNLKFHNRHFWTNVQRQWRDKGILKKAFNYSDTDNNFKRMLSGADEELVDSGLHLLYKGYSWWWKSSWNCTLYEAVYKNGFARNELNMHQVTTKKQTQDMSDVNLDCRKMGEENSDNYNNFFADGMNYRWTVRHATGKELTPPGAVYNKKAMISGTEVVYRYYQHVNPTVDLEADPEETPEITSIDKDNVRVGNFIGQNGCFYPTVEDAKLAGTVAKAMVVWLGGDKRAEKDANWNGLAIALEDITPKTSRLGFAFSGKETEKVLCTNNVGNYQHIAGRCDGWTMTQLMKAKCYKGHNHPAADSLSLLEPIEGFSSWFIPSTGQWDLAMQGLGFGTLSKDPDTGNWGYLTQGTVPNSLNLGNDRGYMTCNEYFRGETSEKVDSTDGLYWSFYYRTNFDGIFFVAAEKQWTYLRLRPFIAFKYGNGGSVNPEETWTPLAQPQARSWLGGDGKFYKDGADVYTSTGRMPAGYVAYYGLPGSVDVYGDKYRGIIIGLSPTELRGLSWDQRDVFLNVYDNSLPASVRKQNGFSEWFVGSKEHWTTAIEYGFGFMFMDDVVPEPLEGSHQMMIRNRFSNNLVGASTLSCPYWTDTADGQEKAWYIDFFSGVIRFRSTEQSSISVDNEKMCVRPMMAF